MTVPSYVTAFQQSTHNVHGLRHNEIVKKIGSRRGRSAILDNSLELDSVHLNVLHSSISITEELGNGLSDPISGLRMEPGAIELNTHQYHCRKISDDSMVPTTYESSDESRPVRTSMGDVFSPVAVSSSSSLQSASAGGSEISLNLNADSQFVRTGTDYARHSDCQRQSISETLHELENALFCSDDEDERNPENYIQNTMRFPPDLNWIEIPELLSSSSTFSHPRAVPFSPNEYDFEVSSFAPTVVKQTLPLDTASPLDLACDPPRPFFWHIDSSQLMLEALSNPKKLLILCAQAISNNNLELAQEVMAKLNQVVSIYGDPIQRLSAYMFEGLVARLESSGRGLYKALKCKEPPTGDLLSAMQIMFEVCPYFKFGYMAANGAIAEAFRNEDTVHILDLEIAQGTQWITLIQALGQRPGGPPQVRITGVGDPQAEFAPAGGILVVGERLAKIAESVNMPFKFHPLSIRAEDLEPSMVELRPGEALAVNSALQLHHMPDESVSTSNPRDRLLRFMKSLNPKVMTLVEQEANTNTAPFFPRFMEALSYYSAVFESLDVTLPRESRDRVKVEQQCLARDIVNIIACEGSERVERHEVIGKWRARMTMAGFQPYPLSPFVNDTIKSLLESYCNKYVLKEECGALCLGWLNRLLVVASAWH